MVLATVKQFFERRMVVEAAPDQEHRLRLATAALLVEMMSQDQHVTDDEIASVKTALMEIFSLTDEECRTLFVLAEEEIQESVDYHQFTHLIAREFNVEQKIKVIELLWSVAYADLKLTALEEHMVRKIADLICVSHKDFMKAKHRVQVALSIAG